MTRRRWTLLAAMAVMLSAVGWTMNRASAAADDAKLDVSKVDAAKDFGHEDADGFVELFNGKDLTGWKIGKNADSWQVDNAEMVVHGPGPAHLFYDGPVHDHDWKNFHLKAWVLTKPHANSGIYFHTKFQEEGWPSQGFEAQVNETHTDPKKTGGLYAVKDVMNISPAQDDQWFLYEIIVQGKHVILKVNGGVTTDWTEPDPPTPPKGMPGRVIQHGTIALQGHDPGSEVHYKSVKIKALPE